MRLPRRLGGRGGCFWQEEASKADYTEDNALPVDEEVRETERRRE